MWPEQCKTVQLPNSAPARPLPWGHPATNPTSNSLTSCTKAGRSSGLGDQHRAISSRSSCKPCSRGCVSVSKAHCGMQACGGRHGQLCSNDAATAVCRAQRRTSNQLLRRRAVPRLPAAQAWQCTPTHLLLRVRLQEGHKLGAALVQRRLARRLHRVHPRKRRLELQAARAAAGVAGWSVWSERRRCQQAEGQRQGAPGQQQRTSNSW